MLHLTVFNALAITQCRIAPAMAATDGIMGPTTIHFLPRPKHL